MRNTGIAILSFVLLSVNIDITVAESIEGADKIRTPDCNENGDCASSITDCHKICGCDRAVYYNETSKSCVVSFKHLMTSQLKIYGEENGSEGTSDAMAERIRIEAEKIFNTIFISVILFLTCCAICVVSACLYCCRISYSDYVLKNDVKALAKKLKRDHIKVKKPTRKPTEPVSESCNVVCEDAGVFVV